MKNNKESSYSEHFDELFEKQKFSFFVNQKYRKFFIGGVILLGTLFVLSVLVIPLILWGLQSSLDFGLNRLDAINDSLPYKDVLPLKEERIQAEYQPNEENSKTYKPEMREGDIVFGNGYILKINNEHYSVAQDSFADLSIKYKAEDSLNLYHVAGVDHLVSYAFDVTQYYTEYDFDHKRTTYYTDTAYQVDDYIGVYLSDNLIYNLNVQVDKRNDSFYILIPLEKVGQTKQGIIVNADNSADTVENDRVVPRTFLNIYKYWLFPDGTGIYVQGSKHFYGHLAVEEGTEAADEDNLKVIDAFSELYNGTQSLLDFIDNTFVLEKESDERKLEQVNG